VKYVVHLSKRKNGIFFIFSSHKLPKQQSTNFWSKGILVVKGKVDCAMLEHYLVLSKVGSCGQLVCLHVYQISHTHSLSFV
jgi:hypothetical protein